MKTPAIPGAWLLAAGLGLALTDCGGGAGTCLVVSDRGGPDRIYEEIGEGTARAVGDAAAGTTHADRMPARLPGGGIVFVSDRDGNPEIYLVEAGGGAARRLTHDPPDTPSVDSAPAPLGRDRIVFARKAPGAPAGAAADLYVVSRDGGEPRRLTADPADDSEPWGSADGRRVAFISGRSGGRRLCVMRDVAAADPDGTVVCAPPAPGPPPTADEGPVFLPDGTIVVARLGAGGVWNLFAVDPEGSAPPRQITDRLTLPYGAFEPIVLDERTLLLTTGPVGRGGSGGDRFVVYRIALGGFNLARVTRDQARYSDFTRRLPSR